MADYIIDKIKIKRGLKANLPVLDEGEPAFCTDTKEYFIGTAEGNKLINDLSEVGDLSTLSTTNKSNLVAAVNENVSLLAETSQQINKNNDAQFYSSLNNHRTKKAIMSIVDDDLRPEVYTLLKPIVETEKVPITCAVITGRVGDTTLSITLSQMKEMQKLGFEFVSHSVTHPNLSTLTGSALETELKDSREWLNNNGFNGSTSIVYPFGGRNDEVRTLARKYYKMGVYIDAGYSKLNTMPINTYDLDRVYYNLDDGTNQVALVKQKIDEAIANDSYLIVGMHCFYPGFDPVGLTQVIQYAKQQGIEIVTLEEGFNRYGNLIDLKTDHQSITLSPDGKGNLKDYLYVPTFSTGLTINTPITSYPQGKSATYLTLSHPSVGQFPGAGVLETFWSGSSAFNYQTFKIIRSNATYIRYWDDVNSVWTPFVRNDGGQGTSQTLSAEGDWTGTVTISKNSGGQVFMRGILTAGVTIAPRTTLVTIPVGFRTAGYFPVFNAFNYTKVIPLVGALVQETSGYLRIGNNANITAGDVIRFSVLYQTEEM